MTSDGFIQDGDFEYTSEFDKSNNEIIIVDCGMSFPDGEMLGVDLVIPDFSYLEANKEKINEQYSFDEKYSDEIFIDSFKIKVLDIDRYSLKYPKYLAFVGVSESTGEIVYIYFESEDLDTIGDSWEDFIKHECNW